MMTQTTWQPVLEAWSPRPSRRPVAFWVVTLPCRHTIAMTRKERPTRAICYLCSAELPAQGNLIEWIEEQQP